MEKLVTFNTPTGKFTRDLFKIIDEKDVWSSGKTSVISYDGCKKLADEFGVCLKETPSFLSQPNKNNLQQHIRGMWLGFTGDTNRDNWIFCEGEASQLNTGQLVPNKEGGKAHDQRSKVDSQYKSNMAYKRAYCRGVLRLIGLIGIYSAVESPVFETNGGVVDYNQI